MSYFIWHEVCGFAMLLLVVLRLVWGVIGSGTARFSDFLRGPMAVLSYAGAFLRRRAPHHKGHNPLGGWMVLFLLLGLATQAVLGLFSNDDIINEGPLAHLVSPHLSSELSSLHRRLFWVMAAAVALHVGAVLLHRWWLGERLIGAMITGRKAQVTEDRSAA